MLHTAPSFSLYNVNHDIGEEAQSRNNNGGGGEEEEVLMRTVTIGDNIEVTASGDFSFGKKKMGLIEEEGDDEQGGEVEDLNLEPENEPASPPMYLASGFGIDCFDIAGSEPGAGGFHSSLPNFDESGDPEDYYKRMVDEYPSHPLFLANYAQLLQAKGELNEAEEYYHRASMADPEDCEILLNYAKLEWQLHHVKERALSNFEHAIQAAPDNSQVLAAYASFLWEIDDDGDELQLKHIQVQDSIADQDSKPLLNASACNDQNAEEYCKSMIEQYPSDSSVLRNYAQFLYQTKRDLQGAEEYYSKAVQADPGNGEIKSQYAKLVWEHRRDHDRASSYFEQAVEAAPDDSQVLAAYASFLWETDENEEDSTTQDQFH
ncbi:uncharacterized protein [Euphorbia lathyris]|uniref:uncharacterized protein n=1 Tax=Euphorbia lathyris TaxID=212925 RepID=UPI0033135EF0